MILAGLLWFLHVPDDPHASDFSIFFRFRWSSAFSAVCIFLIDASAHSLTACVRSCRMSSTVLGISNLSSPESAPLHPPNCPVPSSPCLSPFTLTLPLCPCLSFDSLSRSVSSSRTCNTSMPFGPCPHLLNLHLLARCNKYGPPPSACIALCPARICEVSVVVYGTTIAFLRSRRETKLDARQAHGERKM